MTGKDDEPSNGGDLAAVIPLPGAEQSGAQEPIVGPDYEDAVLDSFLARLDRQTQERVDARVAESLSLGERGEARAGRSDPGLTLGVVSLIAGVPVTAISMGSESGLASLIVAWGGIAAVNVAHAWSRRHAR